MTAIRQARGIPSYLLPEPKRVAGLPNWAWTGIAVLAIIAVLEILPRLGLVSRTTLIPFSDAVAAAGRLALDPEFYTRALLPSMVAILLAFALASVVGIAVGYVIWRLRWVRVAIDPYLTAYYAIPVFALYPMMIALWGQGVGPITGLAAIFSVVAVITSAMNGFDSTPSVIRKLAQSMQVGEIRYFLSFFLPYAMPHILIGLRLAFLYSFLSVLAAEFLLSSVGLGFFVQNAYVRFSVADMFGAILIIIVLAVLAERGITFVVRRLTWIGAGT